MVYRYYIKRGSKRFGPYYYHSYRENGKFKKEYLGTELPKEYRKTNKLLLILILGLIGLAILGSVLGPAITSFVIREEAYQTSLIQKQAEINKPVKWQETIALTAKAVAEEELVIKIPKYAYNIKVDGKEDIKTTKENRLLAFLKKAATITGFAVQEEQQNLIINVTELNITARVNVTNITEEVTANVTENITETNVSEVNTTEEIKEINATEEAINITEVTEANITEEIINETANITGIIEENITKEIEEHEENITEVPEELEEEIPEEEILEINVTNITEGIEEEPEEEEIKLPEENITEIQIEYETPGPKIREEQITPYRKRVIVYSDIHYENILAYTNVPELTDKESAIKLYRIVNGGRELVENVEYLDGNNNGLIDKLQWTVHSLSEQEYEVDITIINVQSYPTLYGNWTVKFNTTSQANLTITPINGTTWSNVNEDNQLKFLEIRCGNQVLDYQWVDNSVFREGYECNEIGYEISKVLIAGKHTLEFRFGDGVEYAYNSPAAPNITITSPQNTTYTPTLIDLNWTYDETLDWCAYSLNGAANDTSICSTKWGSNSHIASGLGDVGSYSAPEVFNMNETWYIIAGEYDGVFNGYNWTGSVWQSDSHVVSGLGDIGTYSTPEVFNMSGIWYLITGTYIGSFKSYNWTGSAWQNDSNIASGLSSVGAWPIPEVFNMGGTWYMIVGEEYGKFYGFNWTGSAWQSDSNIVSGLGDIGYYSAPEVFEKDGIWYLIAGEYYGQFYGYNWTGSAWQSDSNINSSLGDIGDRSNPEVFNMSGTLYLIAGEYDGVFNGFNWGLKGINTTITAQEGGNNITIWANNTAGEMGSDTVYFSVDLNPMSTLISPPNAAYSDGTTTFTCNGSDATALSGITLYIWNSTGTYSTNSTSASGTSAQASWNYTLPEKNYTWNCLVNDTGNRENWDINRTLYVDTTFPQVNFTSPTEADGKYINKNYTYVNVSVSDANNVSSFINWNYSLMGYWSFENVVGGVVYDNSTYGNNGTMLGFASNTTTSGKFGSALQFDGSNDCVDIPSSASLNISNNEVTLEAWVNLNKLPNEISTYMGIYDSVEDYYVMYEDYFNDVLRCKIIDADGTTAYAAISYTQLTTNTWYHVACVYDGNTHVRIYLNGVQIQETTNSGLTGNVKAGQHAGIGCQPGAYYFEGTIDEVHIWNRALSPEEINASYNTGTYRLYHNFTGLVDGNYSYYAQAIDLAGNINQTETRTLSTDTTAPTWSNNKTNASDSTKPGESVYFNVTFTDVNPASYIFATNQTGTWVNYTGTYTSGVPITNITTITATAGTFISWYFWANDTLGNSNQTDMWNFTITNAAPTTPTNIQCDGNDNCNISVDASVVLNASGSTDAESDTITYFVEASLVNATTIQNTTDVSKAGEVSAGGGVTNYTERECSGVWGFDCGLATDSDNTYDTCTNTAGADEHISKMWVNSTVIKYGDAIKVTCQETPSYSTDDECMSYRNSTTGTWKQIACWTTAWTANTNYSTIFTPDNVTGEHQVRCSIQYLALTACPGTQTCLTGGSYYDNDDMNFTMVETGSASSSETNTTATTYEDVNSDFKSVNNITVKVEVDSYNPEASVQQSTNDPDLYLEIYNGSDWIGIGEFDLNETYQGDTLNTTNANFSQTTTDSTIVAAWQTSTNQDLRIKGIYIDYYNSSVIDGINYTNVWVTINGKRWAYIGNHTDGSTYTWDTSGLGEQTCIDLRARAIDLDGSNSYSSYFTKGCCLNISHAPPGVTVTATIGTFDPATINLNGSAVINGTCTPSGGTLNSAYMILQDNQTGVMATTPDSADSNDVYANVSYYSLGSIDSAQTRWFNVTAVNGAGVYNFTIQCNGTEDSDNSTGTLLTVQSVDNYPTANLISPANGNITSNNYVNFTCNATDDNNLANITFYWNYSGSWLANGTNDVSGEENETSFYRDNLENKAILWNCYACDNANQCNFSAANWTVTVDTTISISDCAVLSTAGATYNLIANISNSSTSNCIDITANNITLDCLNNIIDGDDIAGVGIRLYRSSTETTNVTIRNCKVTDWNTENIYLGYANSNTLINITSTSSPDNGISLYSSHNNTLTNIITNNNSWFGVALSSSNNNTLTNITANSNSMYGIYLYYSNSTTLTNITVNSNDQQGIYLPYSHNNIFTNVTANDNDYQGIYLDLSNNNTFTNVSADSNGWYGFYLTQSNNNTFTSVSADSQTSNDGIYLDSSNRNTFTNITANSNRYGIYFYDSDNNTLTNITANSNSYSGFYIGTNSDNNTFTNVIANDNDYYGIYFYYSSGNTLTNVTASNTVTYEGFYFTYSNINTLTNVTANNNSGFGIQFYNSKKNTLTDSKLINNTIYDFGISMSESSNCNNNLTNVIGTDDKPIVYYNSTVTIEHWNNNVSMIVLCNADKSTIYNVTIDHTDKENNGIFLIHTDYTNLTNVSVTDSYDGISLYSSHNNTLTNITANSNSWYGINLGASDSNTLTNVTANSNAAYGIFLYYGSNSNTIKESQFWNNTDAGIFFDGSTCSSNLIYNNLFNNTLNFNHSGIGNNSWNTTKQTGDRITSDGTEIGGNYWANITGDGYSETCTDGNKDGFCDDTYTLAADNMDYLPLSDEYLLDVWGPKVENASFNITSVNQNDHVRLNVTVADAILTVDTVIATMKYPNATSINYTMDFLYLTQTPDNSGDKETGTIQKIASGAGTSNYTTKTCGTDCGGANPVYGDSGTCTNYILADGCAGASSCDGTDSVVDIRLNGTTFKNGDAINVTTTVNCYSTDDQVKIWYYNGIDWSEEFYDSSCDYDGAQGNYSDTITINSDNSIQYIRVQVAYYSLEGDDECYTGDYGDNDDISFGVVKATADTEATTSYTEYTDIDSTTWDNVTKVNVTVYVNVYDSTGSGNNSNNNPDLELWLYDGSSYRAVSNFSISSTGNYSVATTDSDILSDWDVTTNRDLKIRGVNFDYNSSTIMDEINWTEVWVIVDYQDKIDNWYTYVFTDTSATGTYNVTHIIANDTLNNVNETTYTNLVFNVTVAAVAPTWSNNLTNASDSTKTQQSVYFNVTLNDDVAGGYQIFAFYNGTDWVNDSAETWTAPQELEEIRTITATRGQIVKWYWWFNDSLGNSNQTDTWNFTVANTAPTQVTLVSPADGNTTTDRTPTFSWNSVTDADGDSINYTILLNCSDNGEQCTLDDREANLVGISNTSYVPSSDLKLFGDDNYYYNWSVRAYDGYDYGAWGSERKITINSLVDIVLSPDNINFGSLSLGQSNDTTDDIPAPFVIRNDGNCYINISLSSNNFLWSSQTAASKYFQFKIDNVTGEAGAFNSSVSQVSWGNVSTSNLTAIVSLNYSDAKDSAEIDINVEVPLDEPAGARGSVITLTGFYASS